MSVKLIFRFIKIVILLFWLAFVLSWALSPDGALYDVIRWGGLITLVIHSFEELIFRKDVYRAHRRFSDHYLMIPFGLVHLLDLQFED